MANNQIVLNPKTRFLTIQVNNGNYKAKQIFGGLTFSSEEVNIINKVFHKETHKKGAVLLKIGEPVNHQYYILNGYLRSFYIDSEGKEHTVQFGTKDWWISDYTAFFSTSKSIMTIEVLKDATLYRISKEDKEYIFEKIPKIETFFRIKLERSFAAFQKRILAGLSQSATQRYLNFIKAYPDIQRNIKNYHIASYLGIATESLSRIRKELSTQ